MLLRRTSRWSPTTHRSAPRASYLWSTVVHQQCLVQRRYASGVIHHAEHAAGTALLQADVNNVTQADILQAIKTNNVALHRPSHHKVHATFLLSKPFANWATDLDFTRDAITTILQHTTNPAQQSSLPPLQVELLFAVVDAISEPSNPYLSLVTKYKRKKIDTESLIDQVTITDPLKAAPVYEDGRDGFAYCISSHEQQADLDTVDELSSAGGHRRGTSQSIQEAQATLSFHIKDLSSGSQASRKVKVPLAKTLFTNGLQHTMVSSSWIENNATGRFELVHQQQHQHASVTLPLTRLDIENQVVLRNRWFVTTPLIPLTEPREVTASMGNIIRQLGGNDEPASNELETAVMDFYETNDMEVQAAAVWALVVPKATIKQLEAEDALDLLQVDENGKRQNVELPSNSENPDALRSVKTTRDVFSSIPYLLMLRGARLHKVLSGGGGWGKKAGLLSLDPESDYTSEDPTAPPRLLDLDGILDEPKPVQTVAASGDYVRFYIAPNLPDEAFPSKRQGGFIQLFNNHQQTIDFGVLPSSMDDMSMNDKNLRHVKGKAPTTKVRLKARHFGALSEGGMSVEVTDENGAQTMLSKVDVPYSRFSYQYYTYDALEDKKEEDNAKSHINTVQSKLPSQGISLSDALKGRINSDPLGSSYVSRRAVKKPSMRKSTGGVRYKAGRGEPVDAELVARREKERDAMDRSENAEEKGVDDVPLAVAEQQHESAKYSTVGGLDLPFTVRKFNASGDASFHAVSAMLYQHNVRKKERNPPSTTNIQSSLEPASALPRKFEHRFSSPRPQPNDSGQHASSSLVGDVAADSPTSAVQLDESKPSFTIQKIDPPHLGTSENWHEISAARTRDPELPLIRKQEAPGVAGNDKYSIIVKRATDDVTGPRIRKHYSGTSVNEDSIDEESGLSNREKNIIAYWAKSRAKESGRSEAAEVLAQRESYQLRWLARNADKIAAAQANDIKPAKASSGSPLGTRSLDARKLLEREEARASGKEKAKSLDRSGADGRRKSGASGPHVVDKKPEVPFEEKHHDGYWARAKQWSRTHPRTPAAVAYREKYQARWLERNAADIEKARASNNDTTNVSTDEQATSNTEDVSIETRYLTARKLLIRSKGKASHEAQAQSQDELGPGPDDGPLSATLRKFTTEDSHEADDYYRKRVRAFGPTRRRP